MNPILLGLAITLGAPALKEPPKKDAGIVGEWVLESSSFGGKADKIAGDNRYEFTADGKWLIRLNRAEVKALPRQFKVDAKANPATIDVTFLKPDGGALQQPAILGIYKIEGDTLTICYAPGSERPTSFEPAGGARAAVIVLKRAKKKE